MGGNFKRLFATGKVMGHKTKKYKLNEKSVVENEQRSLQLYDENRDNNEISGVGMSYDMLDGDIELQQEEVISTNFIQQTAVINSESFEDSVADNMNLSVYAGQDKMTIKQENNIMLIPKLHPLQNMKEQTVPSSFFSLIRDFFCETSHHRLQLSELKDKLDSWSHQTNNQLTSKSWHSAINNWTEQVSSALDFLCGEFIPLPEEYVPYLEFKTNANIYQWIGAGRDSDVRLLTLCEHWLHWLKPITTITKFLQPTLCNNSTVKAKAPKQASINSGNAFSSNPLCANTIHITITTMAAPTTGIATATTTTTSAISSANNEPVTVIAFDNQTLADNTPPPPPSRCPTNWIVRCAANEEIKEFQRQERERFEHPHRAFTYRLHGYESIVGPVKGIYSEIHAMTKARGHTMMVGDRPNFVTILTLVRDAVARLPNGEGTRADIAELVKSSQYLNHNAAENVLQTIVSGALDRMHTENDPCVRYDPKRKIWIYLHRHRSEEEFERIHHEQQTMLKNKKPNRKHNKRAQIRTVPASTTIISTTPTTTTNNIHNVLSNPPPLASVSATCPLPSLVAANTTLCYSQQLQQQQLKQKQILLKCPPVPPLKYHVPPLSTVQQQKSLLKSRTDDTPQLPQQRILVRPISTTNTTDKVDDRKFVSKQQHPKISQQVTVPRSIATKLTSKTPILLATPNGLQAVHMPNVSNVCGSNTSGIIVTPTTLSTAGMNNKKLTLNKPLIINQITTAKSTQQQQHHKQNKNTPLVKQQSATQQPTQSFIIPFNDAIVQNVSRKSPQSQGSIQAMFVDNNGQIQQLHQEAHRSAPGKNVLRLISTAATATQIKSQPSQNNSTQGTQAQSLVAQKSPTGIITTTAAAAVTTSTTSSSMSGLSIITANRNVSSGTIVKMTPQAFAVLQQQQQQQLSKQQQHIILKPTKMLGSVPTSVTQQQQQRLNVGSSGNLTSQQSQHNVLKTFSPISVHNSSTLTTTLSSIPMTSNSNNTNMVKKGVQTITATNLSLQQQRSLLHGLKQQKQKQQIHQLSKTSTFTNLLPAYSSKQNVTRTINETSTITTTATTTIPTRVITSTAGQIISLEDLLQKQRSKQNSTTIPQIVTLTSCGTQQQTPGSQFGIVVSPTTRGIIAINQTSNTGISTAQSASTPTVANNNMSKTLLLTTTTSTVTSPSISTSKSIISSTVPTSTVPTTKTIISGGRVLMTAPNASSIGGNIRIINTSNTNNINFANLQGKQVVFSTKNQSQLQNSSVVIGGHAVKLQGNVRFV